MDFSFVIFLWKRYLLGQSKRRGTPLTFFRPPAGYSNHPTYYILHKFPTPLLIRITPRLFGTLEYKKVESDMWRSKTYCNFCKPMKHELSREKSFFSKGLVLKGFQCLHYKWKMRYTKISYFCE